MLLKNNSEQSVQRINYRINYLIKNKCINNFFFSNKINN